MSSLKVHTFQSVITSAALYPLIGENAIAFGASVIFIDIDHAIEYARDLKTLDPRGIFTYAQFIEKNLDKNFLLLAAFHTLEFLTLIFLLGLVFPLFMYVFAGLIYHILVDVIYLTRLGYPFARSFSIAEYFIRSKDDSAVTSVHELIQKESIDTNVAGFTYWRKKWGLN